MHSDEPGGSLRLLIPAAAVVVAVTLVAVLFAGGQVSTVLSTVGAAIEPGRAGRPPGDAATRPEGAGRGPADDAEPLAAPLGARRRIVHTGSLDLVVADVPAAVAAATSAVRARGGIVGASREEHDGARSAATVTYRVPADAWDATIEALRGIAARVAGGETQASEVGDQLVDLEARLRNLRASEQVLVGIAEGTATVRDLLEVQSRITEVRGEIERLDAQRAHLEDQAALGTLEVSFRTAVVRVQQTARGWDPAEDVDGATAALVRAGQAIVSAAIWFGIVWLPAIAALAALALVLRWAGRRVAARVRSRGPVAGPWAGAGGA